MYQGQFVNLPWPSLKSKQCMCIELFDIISCQLPLWGRGIILFLRLQYNHTQSCYILLKVFPPKHL